MSQSDVEFERKYIEDRIATLKAADEYNARMFALPIRQRLELWRRITHGENGDLVLEEMERKAGI